MILHFNIKIKQLFKWLLLFGIIFFIIIGIEIHYNENIALYPFTNGCYEFITGFILPFVCISVMIYCLFNLIRLYKIEYFNNIKFIFVKKDKIIIFYSFSNIKIIDIKDITKINIRIEPTTFYGRHYSGVVIGNIDIDINVGSTIYKFVTTPVTYLFFQKLCIIYLFNLFKGLNLNCYVSNLNNKKYSNFAKDLQESLNVSLKNTKKMFNNKQFISNFELSCYFFICACMFYYFNLYILGIIYPRIIFMTMLFCSIIWDIIIYYISELSKVSNKIVYTFVIKLLIFLILIFLL